VLGAAGAEADDGAIRFANAQSICWEADTAGTDVCMSVDSAELFQFDSPIIIADQTAAPGNLVSIYDNDVNTFNTTCSDSGAAGTLSIVDSDKTSSDQWDVCDGTSLRWRFPATATDTTYALFATATAGAPAFRAIVDGDIPNTITASNYLALTGGTLTGQVHVDNNQGLRLSEADGSGSNYVEQQVAARSDDIVLQWNVTPATCTGDGNGGVLTLNGTGPYTIDCEADDGGGSTPDIDSVTGQDDWATAATKVTNDLTFSGVEADFESGASNAWPRLLNEATPTSGDCDAAGESGRLMFDPDDDTDGTVKVCRGAAGWKDIDDDGGTGGGVATIKEDNANVTTSATAIDFAEPDATLVSGATGESEVNMALYAILGGRSAGQNLVLGIPANAADAGRLRLANAETICWEADAAGTDVCMSVNVDELLTTDALTLVVDSDAGGTEPADGAGFVIEGGTGDVAIKYEDTSNENQLQFTGAAGGYSFSSKISVGGTGNAEFVDQGSACTDPASGSTALCTIGGNVYVKDTGATSKRVVDTAVAQKLGGVMFDFGSNSIATSDEWAFRLKPYAQTVTRIECEAYSGTSFTIKVCKNEDLGDDTCATNLLDSTESTTLVCDTTGASDTAINSGGIAARGEVSIVVTAVSGTVTKGEVYIEGTMDN